MARRDADGVFHATGVFPSLSRCSATRPLSIPACIRLWSLVINGGVLWPLDVAFPGFESSYISWDMRRFGYETHGCFDNRRELHRTRLSVSLGYEAIDTRIANPRPAKATPVRSATTARTPRLGDQGTRKMGSPIRNGIGARLPIVPPISRLIPNPPPVHPLIPQKSQSALISRTELTTTGIGRAQSRWSQVRSLKKLRGLTCGLPVFAGISNFLGVVFLAT